MLTTVESLFEMGRGVSHQKSRSNYSGEEYSWILYFFYLGRPLQILTDQGKNFESELFGELCRMMGVEKFEDNNL